VGLVHSFCGLSSFRSVKAYGPFLLVRLIHVLIGSSELLAGCHLRMLLSSLVFPISFFQCLRDPGLMLIPVGVAQTFVPSKVTGIAPPFFRCFNNFFASCTEIFSSQRYGLRPIQSPVDSHHPALFPSLPFNTCLFLLICVDGRCSRLICSPPQTLKPVFLLGF